MKRLDLHLARALGTLHFARALGTLHFARALGTLPFARALGYARDMILAPGEVPETDQTRYSPLSFQKPPSVFAFN
jgi:hypothetical protein